MLAISWAIFYIVQRLLFYHVKNIMIQTLPLRKKLRQKVIIIYLMKSHRNKKEPPFTTQAFLASSQKQKYLHNALMQESTRMYIDPNCMNVEQLQMLVCAFNIKLNRKNMHELFLYATYSKNTGINEQKRLVAIVSKSKIEISLVSVSKWLLQKIQKGKISIGTLSSQKSHSQYLKVKQKQQKLPSIIWKKPAEKLENQVNKVLQIFQKMEKQRQNMGLVPIPIDSDQDIDPQRQPIQSIPYDADFHDVNKNLFQLRSEARQKISDIILLAKGDKKLKQKVFRSIDKYRLVRTEANEKIGRCGAMKAQKRMIDRTKKDIQNLQSWRKKQSYSQFI